MLVFPCAGPRVLRCACPGGQADVSLLHHCVRDLSSVRRCDLWDAGEDQRLLGRGVSFQRKKGDAPAPAIVIPALLLRVCTAAPAADVL